MYQSWYKGRKERVAGVEERCNKEFLENQMKMLFPNETIRVTSIEVNKTGVFVNPLSAVFPQYIDAMTIGNLPDFCDIRIERDTKGGHTEKIYFWAPFLWNGRFAGAVGGGSQTGGLFQIMRPNDLRRGWNMATALINGFSVAMTDGANPNGGRWGIDMETGELDVELIDEWAHVATHQMTLIGKALTEILYGEKPEFSYVHGGSGGGRQSIMEAQHYPEDYDGVWASCPAINWSKMLVGGLWPIAVMNDRKNYLYPAKLEAFERAVYKAFGGKKKYFQIVEPVKFDPFVCKGKKTNDGVITEEDCATMAEIWDGPKDENGNQLWWFYRRGVRIWTEGVGATPLSFVKEENGDIAIKPFFLVADYAAWVTNSPKETFTDINKKDFYKILEKSIEHFSYVDAGEADLRAFFERGGKLLIDHGTNDSIIPPDGTIDYYKQVIENCGEEIQGRDCCRLFFNAGDGHGDCFSYGAGIPISAGMQALIAWVEEGIAPEQIKGVRASEKTKKILEEKVLYPM